METEDQGKAFIIVNEMINWILDNVVVLHACGDKRGTKVKLTYPSPPLISPVIPNTNPSLPPRNVVSHEYSHSHRQ